MLKVVEDILKVSEVKRTVVGSVSTVSESTSTMVGTASTVVGTTSTASESTSTVVGRVSTVSETVSTMVGTASTMNGRASTSVGRAVSIFQTTLISNIKSNKINIIKTNSDLPTNNKINSYLVGLRSIVARKLSAKSIDLT